MDIPSIILAGILRVESATKLSPFGPVRDTPVPHGALGERGVMQVRYDTFCEVKLPGESWSDMDTNHNLSMAIGCRYLVKMYKRMGTWDKAVMAYNAGTSNHKAGLRYLQKVLQ